MIDRSSVLFWAVLLIIVLAYAAAFLLSSHFIIYGADVAHRIEIAADTHSLIDYDVLGYLSGVIVFGALPILAVLSLCAAAFRIERKTDPWSSYSLLFSILGILALPWGGWHLYLAVYGYDYANYFANRGVADPDHALLIIFGGYGLGVGVLWIAVGIIFLLMGRKLRLDSS